MKKPFVRYVVRGFCPLVLGGVLGLRAATVEVAIVNFAYDPQQVTVQVGDTVRWTQMDAFPHTVTSDTGAWTSSPNLSMGQTFSVTFAAVGTYPYYCALHPEMTGTVTVRGGGTNTPPTVSLLNPTNGATFAAGSTIMLLADARDDDGQVTQVQFFDGLTSLGVVSNTPYQLAVPLASGSHTLTAAATDDQGTVTTSAGVTIFVHFEPIANPIAARIAKGDLAIELRTVADGLASPLGLAAPDDGTGRLFVYDQAGLVWVVTSAGRLATPLLDVRSRLVLPSNYDERGLLGLATHPQFAQHPLLYTYTSEPNAGPADFPSMLTPGTTNNHQSVIAEWRLDAANTNRVDPASRRELLRLDKPQANHNGGTLRFGPDGFLYVTVGDGGAANDVGNGHMPGGNAQNTSTILGKVLRLDVDGANSANQRYGLPADNPFVGGGGLGEIYAYGVRNPFAFSFDRVTGQLYLADVGQNKVEEINLVVKGGNYGWSVREGAFWFDPFSGNIVTMPTTAVPSGLQDPIAQYDHDDGLAVIGGFVYRGTQVPGLQGRYVFGDWGTFTTPAGRLFYLEADNTIEELRLGLDDRPLGLWLKGFGEGPDGELYLFGSTMVGPVGNSGKMLKIVPAPDPISLGQPARPNQTNVALAWTGGQGPFALQRKATLLDPAWVNADFSTQPAFASTAAGSAGFFRVVDTAHQPAIPLSAYLNGRNERPTPLTNNGTGFGLFKLEGNTLFFNVRYADLSGPATAAHIHGSATAGGSAGALINLAPFNGGAFGSNGTLSGLVILNDAQKAMVLAGRTYVNIHTADKPGGEIRGQIAPVLMQAALSGANESPTPARTSGSGLGVFTLVGNQLSFNLTYRGLNGPANASHIHGPAAPTTNAGVMINLAPFNGGAYGASGRLAGAITLTPEQLASVVDGLTYVNFHTATYPGGEIRGQLVPQSTAVPFTALLSGLFERPTAVTNDASGSAFFSLEGNLLAFSLSYSNLSGTASASHIHGPATAAQSAGVQINLAPFNGGAYGASGTLAGVVVLTPAQRTMVLNGQTYVNLHTPNHPGGEIRGQITPVLMQTSLSGASERPTPVLSSGSAQGLLTLVLNQLTLNLAYSGLSASASASHIHGPASLTQSAGVLVDLSPLNGGAWGMAGSLAGALLLSHSHLASLMDQLTYVNIHTGNFPGGEIRGQVMR